MAHHNQPRGQGDLASQRHQSSVAETLLSATSSRSSDSTARSQRSGERGSHESKPRLSKDQQEFLESYFQNREHKPGTMTKKKFASELGLPLDKVNNWFQNRRAKFKQDQKKLQGSYDQYYSPQTFDRIGTLDSGYVNSTFYHVTNPPTRHSMIPPHNEFVTPEFMESLCPGANNDGEEALVEEPVLTLDANFRGMSSDAGAFESFFGLDNSPVSEQHVEWDKLSEFRQQFNPGSESNEAVNRPGLALPNSASSPYTTNSNDDSASLGISSNEGRSSGSRHLSSTNSAYQSSGRTSTSSWQSGFTRERLIIEPEQSSVPYLAHWNMPGPSTFKNGTMKRPHADMLHPGMSFAQAILPSQPETLPTTLQNEPIAEESTPPPDKDTEMSQTPIRTTEDDSEPSSERFSLKKTDSYTSNRNQIGLRQASSTSNLAARRQRRPAAISTNASRSSSYTGGTGPASPGFNGPNIGPDATIRRIKSSAGILHGRIQKPAGGPAQRSPLSMNFAESTAPSTLLRRASGNVNHGYSTEIGQTPHGIDYSDPLFTSTQSRSGNLHQATIPEAPQESLDQVWASMPSTANTVYSSVFSYGPVTDDTASSFMSPMETPSDPFKLPYANQYLIRTEGQDAPQQPPHSAPAWQHTFYPQAEFPEPLHSTQLYDQQITPRPYHSNTPGQVSDRGHQRTPSVPIFLPGSQYGLQDYGHASTPLLSTTCPPNEYLHDEVNLQSQETLDVPHLSGTIYQHTACSSVSAPDGPARPDLMFHEYSTPDKADGLTPRQNPAIFSQPRNYVFENRTAEHFAGPQQSAP